MTLYEINAEIERAINSETGEIVDECALIEKSITFR